MLVPPRVPAGTPQPAGPAVRALAAPVQARRLPQRGGSAATRAGTFTAAAPASGPPVYPLGHPVRARQLPPRCGSVTSRAGAYAGTGPPLKASPGPVQARQPLPRRGTTTSRAGTFTFVSLTTGPPVYPLGHPVMARRLPAPGASVTTRPAPYPATPPRRRPLPPAAAGGAPPPGPPQPPGPPGPPPRGAARGPPQKPVRTGRAASRAGIGVFIPPLPFTIGKLTASSAPAAALTTGDRALASLTATSAAAQITGTSAP